MRFPAVLLSFVVVMLLLCCYLLVYYFGVNVVMLFIMLFIFCNLVLMFACGCHVVVAC